MKKTGVLNQDISRVIAGMGHKDMLVIADAGLPIPATTERIDLALSQGVPGFLATLQAIAGELEVEQLIIAEEIKDASPDLLQGLAGIFGDLPIEFIPHEEFKSLSGQAKAIIRTGEFSPFANAVLVSGVVF